jgi:hypothetical protein
MKKIQETRVYGRHACLPSILLRRKHAKYVPSARLALRRKEGGGVYIISVAYFLHKP